MKVLVVDDDALALRVLIALVEKLGHEAIAASDGLSAWALFQEHECRVAISDWTMPGLDGMELLARIRACSAGDYTYFIVLTARQEQVDVEAGMSAGADDLLTKPVRLDHLAARLRVAERIVSLQQQVMGRNLELSAANERMRKDLKAAVQVQASLLPSSLPNLPELDLAWLYQPCEQLGGDTLNVFRLDERHIGFYVLDVSGHGVSSALLAVQVSRVLNPLLATSALLKRPLASPPGYEIRQPLQVIGELNELFPMVPQTMQYFTILYGIMHLPSRTVRFSTAGHPGPLRLLAQGGIELSEVSGNPIGVFPSSEATFSEYTLRLERGDRLYCVSDGVLETIGPGPEVFGLERLCTAISASRSMPLHGSLDAVAGELVQWREGMPARDDVTMIAMECRL